MLYTSVSGYFDADNEFHIKEIYVSDESELYILKASESFIPYRYSGSSMELFDSIKNTYYPMFAMSKVRHYDDSDAKSLATFIMKKIQSVDMKLPGAKKKLFDVFSSFGNEIK